MKALWASAVAVSVTFLAVSSQASADDTKPIAQADMDRLVAAVWAEPPPTAQPPCGLEIKLVRESWKEGRPREVIEKQLRKVHEELNAREGPSHNSEKIDELVKLDTDRAMQEEGKPHFFRERVLLFGTDLLLDRTKLTDSNDTKQTVEETFANLGLEKKGDFRSYHVSRPNAEMPGLYDIAGKGARWGGLIEYARLGAIPSPFYAMLILGKAVKSEKGEPKLVPSPEKIAACVSAEKGAPHITLQPGEAVQGRATVIVTFGWPSTLPNAPATPSQRWTLDKDDFNICYRAESCDMKTGALAAEWTAEGFSPIQGAKWAFPKRTTYQKRDPTDHRPIEYQKCSIESATGKPEMTEESCVPAVPAGYEVHDYRK